ncbi:MAG: 50S ribosomal protein L30 [Candidatus Bathyarchaeota archaeon]|nr:50S ribosomal protein L30 [Candidatus Bathyarchaeota archaeon]MDH5688169.1 50S ribosomal protein L30 [Candidatus Bathyarchaeota archaeon]
MEKPRRCLAVVRVRGLSDVRGEINDTLKMLRLNHNCHAVLIDDRSSYLGMLSKVENQVTWGEVSKDTVTMVLKKRGRTLGNKRLTDEYTKKVGYESLDELAEAVWKLEVDYKSLPDIEPVFRLHPPRKGYRGGVKKRYNVGGSLGDRGEDINTLLEKMI